jgi:hypothetical protein
MVAGLHGGECPQRSEAGSRLLEVVLSFDEPLVGLLLDTRVVGPARGQSSGVDDAPASQQQQVRGPSTLGLQCVGVAATGRLAEGTGAAGTAAITGASSPKCY